MALLKGMKNYIALAVGAAFFIGVLYSLGIEDTWRAVRSANLGYLGLTAVFFLLPCYLRIYKWVLMRDRMGADISFREMNGIFFSSKFWGLVSPMRSGEVAPALLRGDQRGKVLSIILYDRALETFQTLVVFVALFFLLYGVFFNRRTGYVLAGISVLLALFTFVVMSRGAGERVLGWADALLALAGGRGPGRALRGFLLGLKGDMDEFYDATRSYFTVGFSLYNLLLTFLSWGLDMLFFVILFKALGIETSLLVTVTSVMVYSMTAALTPIPGGLGVAELGLALILGHYGYKGEVGGLIVVSRIYVTGMVFMGYALFGTTWLKRRA